MKNTFCFPRSLNWLRDFEEQIPEEGNGFLLNPKTKFYSSILDQRLKLEHLKSRGGKYSAPFLTMLGKLYKKENP